MEKASQAALESGRIELHFHSCCPQNKCLLAMWVSVLRLTCLTVSTLIHMSPLLAKGRVDIVKEKHRVRILKIELSGAQD